MVKKVEHNLQRWRDWCAIIGDMCKVLGIPTDDLNGLFCRFFMKARSHFRNEYKPDMLTGFQRSIVIRAQKWPDTRGLGVSRLTRGTAS